MAIANWFAHHRSMPLVGQYTIRYVWTLDIIYWCLGSAISARLMIAELAGKTCDMVVHVHKLSYRFFEPTQGLGAYAASTWAIWLHERGLASLPSLSKCSNRRETKAVVSCKHLLHVHCNAAHCYQFHVQVVVNDQSSASRQRTQGKATAFRRVTTAFQLSILRATNPTSEQPPCSLWLIWLRVRSSFQSASQFALVYMRQPRCDHNQLHLCRTWKMISNFIECLNQLGHWWTSGSILEHYMNAATKWCKFVT